MYNIILHEDHQTALFIQKGLQYENLHTDTIDMRQNEHFEKNIFQADGIYLLLSSEPDWEKTEQILQNCLFAKNTIPIIMLAQKYNEKLDAFLNKNILSYYVRPFPFRNMANHMRYAIFSQKEKANEGPYILRDLELDIEKHEVTINKQKIYLRNKEFSLLHFFMINKGKILSRNAILENVWDRNANILTNTVDVHVSQLRRKIGMHTEPKFIRTIPCSGYIFE